MSVIGGTVVAPEVEAGAETVGRLLAQAGAIVVTGGREGVAAAACRGAKDAGGVAVGILPGRDRAEANPWVTVAIPTGMGETRNALVVMDADAVIAFPGAHGTLIEAAFSKLGGTTVIAVGDVAFADALDVVPAGNPVDAVQLALTLTPTRRR